MEYSKEWSCSLDVFSREFSHTIKHLTLATWTKEDVDLVTSGGNKVRVFGGAER